MKTFTQSATPIVDAHHHLWRYNADDFGWIDDGMAALRRDFLPAELMSETRAAQIDGTVAVQARCSVNETRFLLDCAHRTEKIWGVVGWLPLASSMLPQLLDEFIGDALFRGVREITQGQPHAFEAAGFDAGIRALTARDLSYDVLIYADQLPEAIAFVDRHPRQRFILDHAAKPGIRASTLEPWRTHVRELAHRPNVCCKLSGLVTEADWHHWSIDSLLPYLDVCVEAFTPARLLAGSDWPVCLVATGYQEWWQTLRDYFASFSTDETAAIFGGNSIREYRLTSRSTEASL